MEPSQDSTDVAPRTPEDAPRDGENSTSKRVNRACLNCRKRKSRCHLRFNGDIVQLPCLRCKRESLECVLGGSNRGGRRVRKKPLDSSISGLESFKNPYTELNTGQHFHELGNVGTYDPTGGSGSKPPSEVRGPLNRNGNSSSSASEPMPFSNLQNPSDALGILAQVAENGSNEEYNLRSHQIQSPAMNHRQSIYTGAPANELVYPLLNQGSLSIEKIVKLLERYRVHYHPYFPLAPPETFDSSRLIETATREQHLLTAILVIASKDLLDEPNLYEVCSSYMRSLVSDLAAGGEGDVGAVEALLILAEWTPYTQKKAQSGHIGRGEEDREAWCHVGIALRLAYFLGLDKFSFRLMDEGKDSLFSRKRLVWTTCYISDRQISIRIGRAFWSRGPGPLTNLRREDYVSLLPRSPNDEDYASIYQAFLEQTQIMSNVHDVLYSNPGSSFRSHLAGGYIKFIDDFRAAIYGWKSVWGTLTCSPHLKAILLMSYDYLRLYTNAFAFQATIRALTSKDGKSNPVNNQAPRRVFYNNVASVGDARFIYEGLDAAKAILSTANNFVDPERSLRFMPLRYYLYLVYSGVFLYRARCVGVMSPDEERAIRTMIQETVSRLQRSSVGIHHLGSRYSQLLKLLWEKVEPRLPNSTDSHFRTHELPQTRSSSISRPAEPPTYPDSLGSGEGTTIAEQMGDFAWTDLSAVGDFAINGSSTAANGPNEDAFWGGFLPLEMNVSWDVNQIGTASDFGPTF
ncbi:hypothetical protein M501DRAFT_1005983 [Patellaria atrata CBS 101060]|uniref:Zn(2)-C6 fungal-type domain-containing protein n=1 Tax=Patellaria atrata CBS 101060 TaxID=1346257 RepID=A0A9P4SKS5_9PEZI|nr:hypothetical protein M501DRAFT_1005983 [Patellaria atrata CBS 101060]